MTGYLIAEEGPLAGLVIRLEDTDQWVLGRDPDEVSIVLEDPMVSRKHVICRLTPEGYTLENLSSVNPVTQNGKVVTEPVLLKEHDILQIGSTFFRFSEKAPQLTPPIEEVIRPKESGFIEEEEDLSSVNLSTEEEMRWFLKVVSGPNSGAEFNMQPNTTYILGKDPNLCDIVFQDLSVSRQHARLNVSEDNQVFIEDLGSRNGVLVNAEPITEQRELLSQDLIALGTTSFLLIDKAQVHETILSPVAMPIFEKETIVAAPVTSPAALVASDWKETIIPTKHLILAGAALLLIFIGIASTVTLFRSETITSSPVDESALIQEAIKGFPAIQFSYNASTGKVLLLGHVLTPVDKQELLYKVESVPCVQGIEDSVVVDEYVWENINALLTTNPQWIGVSLYSPQPGKFVLRGYISSLEQLQALSDYINMNFPYLDRLENQVVVETNLETQIQSMLLARGFSAVSFQLSNGEVVLAGRVDKKMSSSFEEMVDIMKSLKGVRSIKNFVILTTAETSRIDISSQYKISGFSKKDDSNQFIVINGKILSIGEIIDGMTITEILPTMVFLEKDGLKFKIQYNPQ
ncbi:MAG: type secretion integral inner rane ring protein [Chlamydiota bacterium]|jgi:type III secretion system YscD/HrpQ family protein